MCYIAIDPSNSDRVFVASMRLWRTEDDGATWKAVSPVFDDSRVSAVEIARGNPQIVYAGTENGGFFRSEDGGDSWSANLAGPLLPGFMITRIASPSGDARTVYVVLGNTGHSHVFRSRNGGDTWEDVDRGSLPDVPHSAIVIPPHDPQRLYVATDAGVFVSRDAGATWENLSGTLPRVMVADLVYHAADRRLYAATYGRSLWRLQIQGG
jgi:hypothetical protein